MKILEDDEFSEKILDCISVEEIQSCFEDEGMDISESDAKKILSSVYGVNDEIEEIDDFALAYCVGGVSGKKISDKIKDEYNKKKKNKLISSIFD